MPMPPVEHVICVWFPYMASPYFQLSPFGPLQNGKAAVRYFTLGQNLIHESRKHTLKHGAAGGRVAQHILHTSHSHAGGSEEHICIDINLYLNILHLRITAQLRK